MQYTHGQVLVGGLFATINGVSRTRFASLDPTSGAVTSYANLAITGAYPNTGTKVFNSQLSHGGSKMLVEGVFTSVAGQPRQQVFMLDLGSTAATVDAWTSSEFSQACNANLSFYVRGSELVTGRRHRLHRDHRLQARHPAPDPPPAIGGQDCAMPQPHSRLPAPRWATSGSTTPAATRTTPWPPTPITSTSVAMNAGRTTRSAATLRGRVHSHVLASPQSARPWDRRHRGIRHARSATGRPNC